MSLEALPQADVELIEELGLAMTPEGTASHLDVMTAKEGQDLPDFRRPRHAELQWLLAQGLKGCLHVAHEIDLGCTLCGRHLKCPQEGQGLQQALEAGRPWSPRCFDKLSEEQKRWWRQSHQPE